MANSKVLKEVVLRPTAYRAVEKTALIKIINIVEKRRSTAVVVEIRAFF